VPEGIAAVTAVITAVADLVVDLLAEDLLVDRQAHRQAIHITACPGLHRLISTVTTG
jgi:hypothetical protein